MDAKKSMAQRIRGWFPQEPLHKNYAANTSAAPKTKAQLDKKLFKNGWIANSIISAVFLGVNALLIQPHYNYHVNAQVTALSLGVFASALAAANLVLYWRYKKQLSECR
jgi:hypothetical protein